VEEERRKDQWVQEDTKNKTAILVGSGGVNKA
jgi:hypothetical protein